VKDTYVLVLKMLMHSELIVLSYLMILRTVGPYLSTVKVATIRKLFAARTTPAENSAWLSVVATQLSWTGITVHTAVIPTARDCTVPERLYKRVARALNSDESDRAFVLTPDVFAPTLKEVAAVQAEVDDDALTKAIESVKSTVRLSGRHRVDSKKVLENKAAQLERQQS